MRLLVLAVLVLMVLALYFSVKAIQSRGTNKWNSDFKTLPSGETLVYLSKGNKQIEYSSIAPRKNYELNGKTEFDRQADIDIALDDALVWAERHNK